MNEEKKQPRPEQYWIPALIWVALLAALVYTSTTSAQSILSGTQNFIILSLNTGIQGGSIQILYFALTLALIFFLVNAWLKFASLTTDLVAALAGSRAFAKAGALFFYWLVPFESQEDEETKEGEEPDWDPADVETTYVTGVVRWVAYSWVVLILSPGLISIVITYIQG